MSSYITFTLDFTPALQVFCQTIQAAQDQKWSSVQLEARRDERQATITRLRTAAEHLAQGGNQHAVFATLATLLQEWAIWTACGCLLNLSGKRTLNPSSDALHQSFLAEARRTAQGWLAELEVAAQRGQAERAQAQRELDLDWAGRAQNWQREAYTGLVQQRETWKDAQAFAQAWADTALSAVQTAQQGVQISAAAREPYEQRRHVWGDRLYKVVIGLFCFGVGFLGFWWVLFEITTHIFPGR